MQCERAQEFFSDYLERTLDRPMTVALEAHVSGCAGCRDEIEALQSTFYALELLPEVTPPADGAWQVMNAMRQARAEQWEMTRHKAPGLLEWLRSLNPLSVTMGAGLATLIIGGGLFATGLPGISLVRLGFLPVGSRPAVKPAAGIPVSEVPALGVTFGKLTAQGPQVDLHVSPSTELPDTHVKVLVTSQNLPYEFGGPSAPSRPLVGALMLPQGGAPEVLKVTVESASARKQYQYAVLIPPGAPRTEPVTLASYDQPVEDTLRKLGPYLSTPVVVDGGEPRSVTLSLNAASPAAALKQLAEQLSMTVKMENGVTHLAAKP